jgi:penicillin-binding protein 1A
MARRFGITTPISHSPAMALGSSEVRLIDMVRAYASIARGGVAVAPYGVRRVTTASGTVVYEHVDDTSRQLVTPWIAAQMTDLLQAVVVSGTGRLASLGRPTAGKTGTTSSEKDGWFIGFSSGMTTGIWYGRDDNRRIPGLAGGKNPAQAFHDYMSVAVANRPVEPLNTQVAAPEWQNNSESNVSGNENFVDPESVPQEPGLPDDEPSNDRALPAERPSREPAEEDRLDQDFIDRAINRRAPPQQTPSPSPARTPPSTPVERPPASRLPPEEPPQATDQVDRN